MRRNFMFSMFVFLTAFILLVSCGKRPKTADSQDASNQTTAAKAQKNVERVPVEVVPVTRGDISNYILLSSNLETEVMADVYSRVQGIVEEIYKEEGQYVKKGEVLCKLEAKEYELTVRKAQIDYDQQLSNYKRLEAMHNKKLLSDEEFEKARFALEASQVQLDEAKLNLGYTEVRSPISGRVGERLAKIGKRIQPTDKLFSVVDNSQVIAVVYVPEKSLNQLKIRQKALVTSDNLPGKEFSAWIKRISPVVDPSSGTFKVTVGVRNSGNQLRPGMFVNVHIVLDTHKNVVLIPKSAIVYENEDMNVFVVRDSVAHKVRLQVGYQDNEQVESLKGVKAGENIIVIGQAGMKDRTPVNVVTVRKTVPENETP